MSAEGARGEAAGLVSSKTSANDDSERFVSFGQRACAERRVARLKKAVWASGHLHGITDDGKRPAVPWFVTLTYRGVDDWEADHVKRAVDRFRQWCKVLSIPCRYTWVAELQVRGAVHYHLIAWLPVGVRMPQWDRERAGKGAWWTHGMTNTQVAKAGVGYLMKYLSKLGELTIFPKGLRLYGIGGLTKQGREVRAWLNLPEWCKCAFGVGEVARKGFGLVVRESGEVLKSPYVVQLVPGGGGLFVRLVGAVAQRFHDGAYSTLRVAT